MVFWMCSGQLPESRKAILSARYICFNYLLVVVVAVCWRVLISGCCNSGVEDVPRDPNTLGCGVPRR